MADEVGTPPTLPPTPEQAGAAAARQQAVSLAQEAQQARLDALDIQDPTQRAAPAPITSQPETKPESNKPNLIPGATVEKPSAADDRLARLEQQLAGISHFLQNQPPRPTEQVTPPQEESLPDELYDAAVFDENGQRVFRQRDQYWLDREKKLRSELTEIKNSVQQQQRNTQQQYQAELERQWTDALAATPAEYKDLVGDSYHSATPAQQQAQSEVADMVDSMMAVNQQRGKRSPPMKVMYERALRAIHGDKAKQVSEAKVIEQARNAAGEFVARPTSVERNGNSKPRNQTSEQREENAVAALTTMLAQRGRY